MLEKYIIKDVEEVEHEIDDVNRHFYSSFPHFPFHRVNIFSGCFCCCCCGGVVEVSVAEYFLCSQIAFSLSCMFGFQGKRSIETKKNTRKFLVNL